MSFGLFQKLKKYTSKTAFLTIEIMSVVKALEEELLRSIQTGLN